MNYTNSIRTGRRRTGNRPAAGFSLIELMVVIAIVGVLASISVGAYRNYVLRANRTDGRTTLLSIQVAQEKFYLQNNSYATNMGTVRAAPPAGLGINVTAGGLTPGGHYTISFAAATANTYRLQAVATGQQATDTAACLTFTVDEQGVRTPADSTGCWR